MDTTIDATWNVLKDPWMNVVDLQGNHDVLSPLEILKKADQLQAIEANSPLDVFSAYRFLLTLLYWKAESVGGVNTLRKKLLNGAMPSKLLNTIKSEDKNFELFDKDKPFLQDASLNGKKGDAIGYLFSECATGTNVSHFQHGDDSQLRLCLRCVTAGLTRVVPWTQSGGAGKTPSIHNAPPFMLLALGQKIIETLGLNLVLPDAPMGEPTWSGTFQPEEAGMNAAQWNTIPVMEALTWNPRRIHLMEPEKVGPCWRCGVTDNNLLTINKMVFLKNEYTKKPPEAPNGFNFPWNDPAAYYPVCPENPSPKDKLQAVTTRKSTKEHFAFIERDLDLLANDSKPVACLVQQTNSKHDHWLLIAPCTDAANNKSFDIRSVHLSELTAEALEQARTKLKSSGDRDIMRGWKIPYKPKNVSWAFLQETNRFSNLDWGILSNAANRTMDQSPEAFDLFSGLYWRMRNRRKPLPSRQTVWLVLKLMATTPSSYRTIESDARFNPLEKLPQYQASAPVDRKKGALKKYPRKLLRGVVLETNLRVCIQKHLSSHNPTHIAWTKLCDQLNELLR